MESIGREIGNNVTGVTIVSLFFSPASCSNSVHYGWYLLLPLLQRLLRIAGNAEKIEVTFFFFFARLLAHCWGRCGWRVGSMRKKGEG